MKIIAALVVLVAVAAGWFYAQSRRTSYPTPDGQVIEQLRKADSDLSKLHDIEFFLYFPGREAAEAAMKELRASMDFSKAEIAGSNNEWMLQLTRSMQPSEAALTTLRTTFNQVATRNGGEYDGWGTEVVSAQ